MQVDSLGQGPPSTLLEDRNMGWEEADLGEGEVSAVVGGPMDQKAPRDPMAGDEEEEACPSEGGGDCIQKSPSKGGRRL